MNPGAQPIQVCFVGDSFVAGIGDETALEQHPVWRQQVLEGDGAHPRAEGYTALCELVAPAWDSWLTSAS
ncbi:hypothetical protein [Arthrobacter sp. GMC3]|uniref:hypothetical protein n=1 Tax=Arthrobacter sp. GMC3 TaxID=2058894 RepID=UPI0011B01A53|nr:hypothetical protein [Arthrobacter sp. GMC3]